MTSAQIFIPLSSLRHLIRWTAFCLTYLCATFSSTSAIAQKTPSQAVVDVSTQQRTEAPKSSEEDASLKRPFSSNEAQVVPTASEETTLPPQFAAPIFLLDDNLTGDKVVAVIDQEPILLSELDLEVRIALISQGGTEAAGNQALGNDVLKNLLPMVIDQRLADKEALRMQNVQLSADEKFAALDKFAMHLGGGSDFLAFLSRHETNEQRIFTILERNLRVERFLTNKIQLSARVSDADIQDYYDAHADRLGETPTASVKKSIHDALLLEKIKEETILFFRGLRERTEIRILPPFTEETRAYDTIVPLEKIRFSPDGDTSEESSASPKTNGALELNPPN